MYSINASNRRVVVQQSAPNLKAALDMAAMLKSRGADKVSIRTRW